MSINRIRILLLAQCFGISAATGLINTLFLRSEFILEPGALFSAIAAVVIVLASTGIIQIIGNEKWLQIIIRWSDSALSSEKDRAWQKGCPIMLRLFVLFALFWVMLTVLLLILRNYLLLTATQCLVIGGIGLAAVACFFAGWFLVQGIRRAKRSEHKTEVSSPAEIADAFLRFPLRSAGLSLLLWFYAGVSIALLFYYWVHLSKFTSFYILVVAFGTGILAFPLQYLLFKRTLQGLVQNFLEKNPGILENKNLFQVSLQRKLLTYFLSLTIFAVSISFLVTYSRASKILRSKSARLCQMEFSREMEEFKTMDLDSLQKALAARNSKAGSYFLISKNGDKILGDPESQMGTSQLKEIAAKREGFFLPLRSDAIVVFHSLPDQGLTLGKIYAGGEVRSDLRNFQSLALALIALISIVCAMFAFLASSEISSPLKTMVNEAKLVADRNFEDRPFPLSNDEMNDLARSFYQMREGLKTYVQSLSGLMEKVEGTASAIDSTTRLLSRVAREQAQGSLAQADWLNDVYGTLEELAAIARQLNSKGGEIKAGAEKTAQAFKSGNQILVDAISAVNRAKNQVGKIQEITENLESHSRKIKDIVEIIEEISVQSNLLAFNALVESSQAGEAGQRFAVVANQMKRLAAMTKELNTNIGAIIQDVMNSVVKITKATREGGELMDRSAGLVNRAGEAFGGFSSLIDLSVTAANEIVTSMDSQVKTSEQMTATIASVKSIAQKLAGGTAEIENSAEELLRLGQELKKITSAKPD